METQKGYTQPSQKSTVISCIMLGVDGVVNTSHHTISGVVPIVMCRQISSPVHPVILQHGKSSLSSLETQFRYLVYTYLGYPV